MKIEALDLNSEDSLEIDPAVLNEAPVAFWRRQFQQDATPKQKVFDWVYGVGIPLVCVAADPIVFSSGGLLATYRPFAYLLSSVSILTMAAWLLWGKRLGWVAAPLAGLFVAGSFVSFVVGVILLPYSLIGTLFLIGLLGYTPLFSAVVFLRNGVRAFRTSKSVLEEGVVWRTALLAALFGLVIPYVINVQLSSMVDEIVNGDLPTIRSKSTTLLYLRPLVDPSPIARRYYETANHEKTSPRARELARVYEELTGENIEIRLIAD